MSNGMDMTKEQFLKLPRVERDGAIFDNLSDIKKMVKGYKLYQKLTAIIGAFLSVGAGTLFMLFVRHVSGE